MGKEENIERILKLIEQLDNEEKKVVLERTNELLDTPIHDKKPHKLTELAGLGAELWQGINPDEYVRNLRDDWKRDF